jgi:hypothetical protein
LAAQPGNALRATRTASRRSLRDARAAFATGEPSAAETRYERPDSDRGKSHRQTACTSCGRRSGPESRPWPPSGHAVRRRATSRSARSRTRTTGAWPSAVLQATYA